MLGVEVLTDKLGAAEIATAEATRVVREAWREKENIVVQVAKAVDEKGPIKAWAIAERAWLKYIAFRHCRGLVNMRQLGWGDFVWVKHQQVWERVFLAICLLASEMRIDGVWVSVAAPVWPHIAVTPSSSNFP